ncbi:MAG: hypothetical protein JSU86_03475, partial [Phycisphaerales bacterium]
MQAFCRVVNDSAGGGLKSTGGGVAAERVARWDGAQWWPLGSGMDDRVGDLTVHNGELIAGGSFTIAGGNISAFWARRGRSGVLGDANGDQFAGSADFAGWDKCASGPASADAAAVSSADCLCIFNSDGDADIDLAD